MRSFSKNKSNKLSYMQTLLLALLRAQLWQQPVDDIVLPESEAEWDALLDLAYRQTVVCFVAKACLRHKDNGAIPEAIREELQAVLEENAAIHIQHNFILSDLITKFEEQGLHPVLLKGQGIAQMYPEPELRQCGDIDLYFLPGEYEKAKEIIGTIEDENSKKHEDYKHYDTSYNGVEVEIHRHTVKMPSPFMNRKYQTWTSESMADVDQIAIQGKKFLIAPLLYNIVYSLIHILQHYEKHSISLRQMCDFFVMLRYYEGNLKADELASALKKYDALRFWKVMAGVLSRYLGMSGVLLEDKNFAFQSDILIKRIFGTGAIGFWETPRRRSKWMLIRGLQRVHRTNKRYVSLYKVLGSHVFWQYANAQKLPLYQSLWNAMNKA